MIVLHQPHKLIVFRLGRLDEMNSCSALHELMSLPSSEKRKTDEASRNKQANHERLMYIAVSLISHALLSAQ
jgi:hypothetical protein